MLQHFRVSNVSLNFGDVIVNNVNHTSGIFIGENYQYAWSAHFKANHGFGESLGYNCTASVAVVFMYDNDYIDAPIYDNDIITGNVLDTGPPFPVSIGQQPG